jgi:hypothetical protein
LRAIKKQFLFYITLALVGVCLWLLHLWSPGYRGGGDTYNHYLIAKFSWKYPHLILDYWGKPLYNLIASPFTQLGLQGSVLLNIVCLLGSSLLVFLTAKELQLKYYFLAGIVVLFSPIFIDTTISSLTEPLCAMALMIAVFLVVKEKYVGAALVAGFLPHLRSEGLILMGVLAIFLVLKSRSWKVLVALAAGSLVFNTLGWFQTGEPFWIITNNPYIQAQLRAENICGVGTPFHYFWKADLTFGWVTSGLLLVSAVLIAWKHKKPKDWLSPMVLILALFLAYFGAHAFIWWKGMMGSCGYIRVMTVIAPLTGLLVAFGIGTFDTFAVRSIKNKGKSIVRGFVFVLFAVVILTPVRYYRHSYPIPLSEEETVFQEVNTWLKAQDFGARKKVYLNPYLSVIGDYNPYDNAERFDLYQTNVQWIEESDIVIWDAHFCPNEGQVPKETFTENDNYKLLESFKPDTVYKTLNDFEYEVLVFEKVGSK